MIQVVSTRAFSSTELDLIQKANEIHQKEILIDSGRGAIVDRKGQHFVGEVNLHLLVFPQSEQQMKLKEDQFTKLAKFIQYPPMLLQRELTRLTKPTILTTPDRKELVLNSIQKAAIEELRIPGIFVIESDQRMAENKVAQQVIGRIGQSPQITSKRYQEEMQSGKYTLESRIGITGLEAAFEPFLHSEAERVLRYTTDGRGKALIGAQVRLKEKKSTDPPYVVVTTLDKELQAKIDQILAEEQVDEGAVVVQEIQTGKVLAMSSRPSGKNNVQDKNPWDNRAIMEATPGSIFKTVIAIAALEEEIVRPDTVFHCQGHLEKYKLKDEREQGHGKITFAEAYAKSCNIVFGQVAEKLGGEKIEAYARRLGLGQEIIWSGKLFKEGSFRQLPQEQTGVIFASEELKKDAGAVVQAGIGQRDVKITPLQAANLITALFHRGKTLSPRIVTELRDQNGQVLVSFPNKYLPYSQLLKASTIREMQKMMRMVVKDGTATALMKTKWPVAGKTGTAQVGVENNLYHKWMVGFGPFSHPKYSVAVMIRSVKSSDDARAKKIFQKVMDEIFLLESQNNNDRNK